MGSRYHTKHAVFMDIACSLALLGTCDRKQVGAVIIRDGRCISWGYNGAPPGMPECGENGHGYNDEARRFYMDNEIHNVTHEMWQRLVSDWASKRGCKNATHAEANALAFAARQGISTEGATLFVTVSPCETCARLIIAAGIKEVIWDEQYRDRSGIELLERAELVFARSLADEA